MLALAQSLVSETTGWVAVLAAAVVTGGLAPSLWLGRTVPIVRWIVLGTVAGTALSWIGVLFIAFVTSPSRPNEHTPSPTGCRDGLDCPEQGVV